VLDGLDRKIPTCSNLSKEREREREREREAKEVGYVESFEKLPPCNQYKLDSTILMENFASVFCK